MVITAGQPEATDPPGAASAVTWLAQGLESLFDDRPYRGPVIAGTPSPDFDTDLVIVASGYGAAVAARQFAGCWLDGPPLRISILERGDETLRGSFPSQMADPAGHLQFSTPDNPQARGDDGLSRHFDEVRHGLVAGPPGQPNTVAGTPLAGLRKTAVLKRLQAQRSTEVPITVAPARRYPASGRRAAGRLHRLWRLRHRLQPRREKLARHRPAGPGLPGRGGRLGACRAWGVASEKRLQRG